MGLTLSSKALRRILIWGFTQLFQVPDAVAMCPQAFEVLHFYPDLTPDLNLKPYPNQNPGHLLLRRCNPSVYSMPMRPPY